MGLRILFVGILVVVSFGAFSQRDVEIKYEFRSGSGIVFTCTNNTYCDQMVKVTFDVFTNLKSDRSMPFVGTVRPGASTLFTLTRINAEESYDFSYNYSSLPGMCRPRIKDDYPYLIPAADGKKVKIVKIDHIRKFLRQKEKSKFYAYGFAMNVGDTVYASRGGRVCNVSNTNPVKGKSLVYSSKAAYVNVYHRDGTFGRYSRIDGDKIFVESGQHVNPGDPIGIVYSAKNYNSGPCVIFSLSKTDGSLMDKVGFSPNGIEYISIPVMFLYNKETISYLVPNIDYISSHTPEVVTKEMSRRKRKKWLKAHKG